MVQGQSKLALNFTLPFYFTGPFCVHALLAPFRADFNKQQLIHHESCQKKKASQLWKIPSVTAGPSLCGSFSVFTVLGFDKTGLHFLAMSLDWTAHKHTPAYPHIDTTGCQNF